jgi:signal transduction histidine kinase
VSLAARILVGHHDGTAGARLADDLRRRLGQVLGSRADRVDVVVAASTDGILRAGHEAIAAGAVVPVAFVDDPDTLVALDDDDLLASTRTVLVTDRPSLQGVEAALQRGAVHAMLTEPWTPAAVGELLEAHLATYLLEHAPDRVEAVVDLIDDDERRQALERIEYERGGVDSTPETTPLLIDSTVNDVEIERRMVDQLDRTLGHPPRIRVAPGTILIEQGDDVGGIYVILDGVVRLTSRTPTGDKVLHEQSTGAIIGLLSLAEHRRAMQRCRAVTDVRAIPVTLDQLARALDASPELSRLLMLVLVNSLARRLRRSDELQIELDQSLADLSAARAQLVASERFAALGEMAAGMAHELNNPAAALGRAVEHVTADVVALLRGDETAEIVRDEADRSMAVPTSELRRRRRELIEAVGDRRLAERLLGIGVHDPDEARRVAGMPAERLDRLELAARLGRALRNAERSAAQIEELVSSLRAYARGDDAGGPRIEGVDVVDGVETALRLVAHRLGDIGVDRHFETVEPITAAPGALQQVWTNLLTNAIDAIGEGGGGRIEVEVRPLDPSGVLVRVIDDGPGIEPDLLERIFEPRFTTKDGRVRYGLGLGLSISRGIVEDHGGTVEVDSRPGRTEFAVRLPADRPDGAVTSERTGESDG